MSPKDEEKSPKPNRTPDNRVPIHIDQELFKVDDGEISAEDLRALPDPDIGADRDLYQEVPGQAEDNLMSPNERVTVKPGMHFFTAPRSITPGGHAA